MPRPKPRVLLEVTNKLTYRTEQVLRADGVYAVFYDDQAINLKIASLLVQYPGPKYKKVNFSNVGHARNLARKLNTQFRTDRFSVVLLTKGHTVFPDERPSP